VRQFLEFVIDARKARATRAYPSRACFQEADRSCGTRRTVWRRAFTPCLVELCGELSLTTSRLSGGEGHVRPTSFMTRDLPACQKVRLVGSDTNLTRAAWTLEPRRLAAPQRQCHTRDAGLGPRVRYIITR